MRLWKFCIPDHHVVLVEGYQLSSMVTVLWADSYEAAMDAAEAAGGHSRPYRSWVRYVIPTLLDNAGEVAYFDPTTFLDRKILPNGSTEDSDDLPL